MSNKPLNPKGTRDFNPITLQRRRYIIDIISSTFESFGYNEIETPSIDLIFSAASGPNSLFKYPQPLTALNFHSS